MKKRILSIALIASLVLSAAGCGETGNSTTDNNGTTATARENVTADEDSVAETESAIEETEDYSEAKAKIEAFYESEGNYEGWVITDNKEDCWLHYDSYIDEENGGNYNKSDYWKIYVSNEDTKAMQEVDNLQYGNYHHRVGYGNFKIYAFYDNDELGVYFYAEDEINLNESNVSENEYHYNLTELIGEEITKKTYKLENKITEETTEGSEQDEQSATGEVKVGKDKLVPDCPVTNSDLDFGEVYSKDELAFNINDKQTFKDYIGDNDGSSSPVPHVCNDIDFFFESINFGYNFELIRDGEVLAQEYDASHCGYYYKAQEFSDCIVKGVAFYSKKGEGKESTVDNMSFNGVHLNMHREDVEAILGEGHVGTNQKFPTVMYNDGSVTMVIEYYPANYEKVQTIYLIKNN